MDDGDILGHEPMGIVEEVGSAVTNISVGDRVVIPFQIACGHCFMCDQGLHTQCETTQVREQGMGAALFGYTKLYGQVPGGAGGASACASGAIRTDQGSRGSTGRSLCVSLGRSPHSMAGGAVRRHPQWRQPGGAWLGSDRRYGVSHRASSWRRAGNRNRSCARAPRAGEAFGVEALDLQEHDAGIVKVVRDLTQGRGPDSSGRCRRYGGARSAGRARSRIRSLGFLPDALRGQAHGKGEASIV